MLTRLGGCSVIPALLIWLLFTPHASAQKNIENPAVELAGLLKDYRTFEASFIQILVSQNGNKVQESRGQIKAKRPGHFYWETSSPHSQFIASDGHRVEVYDPDLEQVTEHSLDERVSTTPALLLSGEVDNLAESYSVSGKKLGEDGREFILEPKDQDSLFISLRLTFSGGQLEEMRMEDSLSQLSVLSFQDIRVNQPIPEEAFNLDYPDSVDVIREGP